MGFGLFFFGSLQGKQIFLNFEGVVHGAKVRHNNSETVLFSENGQNIWSDKKKLHSARRKKGKQMFNAAWRDLWLAFLNSLALDRTAFNVSISSDAFLWFSTTPILFTSKRGYRDPVDNGRLIPLDDYELEDEESNDFTDDFDDEGGFDEENIVN